MVIADEHHVYRQSAKAFSAALRDLHPRALIGLTATPDVADRDKIVFQYTLAEAIADEYVKIPVIVYRADGTADERTQLTDACRLLELKEAGYAAYREANPEKPQTKPVLFVVASDIEHSRQVGELLAQPGLIGDGAAVLEVTSQSTDQALAALQAVEEPDSPVRAIVSVDMLREGWDVKNIAVIVALRKLASQTLTEQILGRGLRLPFETRTGILALDQVDLVAHDSYKQLLAQKDALALRVVGHGREEPDVVVDLLPTGRPDPGNDPSTGGEGQGGSTRGFPRAVPVGHGQDALLPGESEDAAEDATGDGQRRVVVDLQFVETDTRLAGKPPVAVHRLPGAPTILFPKRVPQIVPAPFDLSDVTDATVQTAGMQFARELPTYLKREALEAARHGEDVTVTAVRQKDSELAPELEGVDLVRATLVQAVTRLPEVTQDRRSRNAAARLVTAFMRGADPAGQATGWGVARRDAAVEGIRRVIAAHLRNLPSQTRYQLIPVQLPLEPAWQAGDALRATADAPFIKGRQYTGWSQNVMPFASFDARSTEWAIAQMVDTSPQVRHWLRIYTNGEAWIEVPGRGRYYPDFIVIDQDDTRWVVEGKSDKEAEAADVVAKRRAAEAWARAVRDDGSYGTWRYLFVTESLLRTAHGSWPALVTLCNPE